MFGKRLRYTFCAGMALAAMLGFTAVQLEGARIVVPDDFPTVAEGVAAASSYDEVFVRAGTYCNETVVIDKPLTLAGEGKETTIIDNTDDSWYHYYPLGESVVIIESSRVTIKDMTIKGGWDGVKIASGYVVGDLRIDNVIFWWNGYAFNGRNLSGNVLIENCLFELNEFCGVGLLDSSGCSIRNCEFGAHFDNSIRMTNTQNCDVSDNIIRTYMYSGVVVVDSSGVQVKRNQFETGDYGVYLGLDLQNVVVSDNVFSAYGGLSVIRLYNVTGNPRVYHNDILGDFFYPVDMIVSDDFSAVGWDDGYPSGGNYWYDYAGVDANGDGIGDTPYEILCSSGPPHPQDIYPLMKPYRSGIEASVHVSPSKFNSRNNGQFLNAYIELPEGYSVEDIDLSTVQANKCVSCEIKPYKIKDFNKNGILDLKVKFDRCALLKAIQNELSPCEIKISGDVNGVQFVGFCHVKVKR